MGFLFSYQGCTWFGASPTCLQVDTWSEGLVSGGNLWHSNNAQLHWSHISVGPFHIGRRFGPLVVHHKKLLERSLGLEDMLNSLMFGHVTTQNNHMRELKAYREPWCGSDYFTLLTGAFLAGVGQVVVAGYITPAPIIMPHHHHAVFSWEEITVRLPSVPVLVQL